MKKILVIEDDGDLGVLIGLVLFEKYQVQQVRESKWVMSTLAKFRPDLIIMDYTIGQKVAPDIIDEIKTDDSYATIPFILFSGHHDIERMAHKLKAAAFLPKPFELYELQNCVDMVLESEC